MQSIHFLFINVESKRIKATNELIYKNRNRLTDVENKLTVTRGYRVGRISWENGTDIYTLQYVK